MFCIFSPPSKSIFLCTYGILVKCTHPPPVPLHARQHQCSKQAIRCHRKFLYIIYIIKMCTTYINASKKFFCVSFMDRLFLKVGHTKKKTYHIILKINSYHCYCEYSTFALQRSFVELLTLLLSNGCNDLDFWSDFSVKMSIS